MPYYGEDECATEASQDSTVEDFLNRELMQAEKRLAVLDEEKARLLRTIRGCRGGIDAMNSPEDSMKAEVKAALR